MQYVNLSSVKNIVNLYVLNLNDHEDKIKVSPKFKDEMARL